MALHKLESLNEAQRLLNRAAHREVIDAHVFDDAVGIDDKQPPTWGQIRFNFFLKHLFV